MKFSSYREIVENYIFLKDVVKSLDNNIFLYMTTDEIIEEKLEIIEDLRTDAAFKLFTKFEARVKSDYKQTIESRWKDALSKKYHLLCRTFRRRNKLYDKPVESVSKKVSFEDIVVTIRDYLKETSNNLHRDCSKVKGHIQFRNWYAHGRYFSHTPVIPDPEDLEITFSAVESVLDR